MGQVEGDDGKSSPASPSVGSRIATPFRLVGRGLIVCLKWSVPYRSANRSRIDPFYAAVWRVEVHDESIRSELHAVLPDIPEAELPTDEYGVRQLIRERLPPGSALPREDADDVKPDGRVGADDAQSASDKKSPTFEQSPPGEKSLRDVQEQTRKILQEYPEETWTHLPLTLRNLLASWNAHCLEDKIELLIDESFHTRLGSSAIGRARDGIRKAFKMMRFGFKGGVSKFEYYGVPFWALFLAFMACYPDVAAGFLGERSYNERSVGSRIATLCQLFSLMTFPYHSFRLLYNWSLERLFGALIGNSLYALSACVPALERAYHTQWFRWTLLALSLSWQIGVQFFTTVRNYVSRVRVRKQMRGLRLQQDADAICWEEVDKIVNHETMSLRTFIAQQSSSAAATNEWQHVPYRVRVERFIKFSATYELGRPCDQLVGIIKDDLEDIINIYDDYALSAVKPGEAERDKGHIEPRMPKLLLVFFDIGLFAYINYSFWSQPFTFNTTVAYGTVVILKQAVLALKKYQTLKSATRLFTNMVSFNVLGIFLVSTPVTVNPNILAPTGNFVAFLLAMVFATLFLAEPIAPILLRGSEKLVELGNRYFGKTDARSAPHAGPEELASSASTTISDEKDEADRAELERESLSGDLDEKEPEHGTTLTKISVTQV